MSDHGHFSSYEGHKERRTGKIRGAFSRMHRALDGWMLARAPASPAQGLHHLGPRNFSFSYFCIMCGLDKLVLRKASVARVNRRLRRYYLIVRLLPNVFALACRS